MFDNHMSVVENFNVNFGKDKNKKIDENKIEELYNTVYKPLLHVVSQWHEYSKDIQPLIDHKVKEIEIPILPIARMVEKIKEYNAGYVKMYSLGILERKYKQVSNDITEEALYLDKNYANAYKIDQNFIKTMIKIKNHADMLIGMLSNDFGFQQ